MDDRYVVQFLHPGREHTPDEEGFVAWNRGPHKRKFVECRGMYIDENWMRPQGATVHFWTEWEAESRLIRRFPRRPGYPQHLFEPLLQPKRNYHGLCNTDPCVFGGFFYCVCQQRARLKRHTGEPGGRHVQLLPRYARE